MRTTNLAQATKTFRDNLHVARALTLQLKNRRPAPGDDTLEVLGNAAEAVAELAAHYAAIAEEIRYDLPVGYNAGRPADGIRRPVEDLLVAQENRGVMPLITEAVNSLNRAVQEAATAVYEIDHAIARWEGTEETPKRG